jgi:hypothetical protein
VTEEVELFFSDENAWWQSLWTHGTRRPLDHLVMRQPEVLAIFKEECLARVRALTGHAAYRSAMALFTSSRRQS